MTLRCNLRFWTGILFLISALSVGDARAQTVCGSSPPFLGANGPELCINIYDSGSGTSVDLPRGPSPYPIPPGTYGDYEISSFTVSYTVGPGGMAVWMQGTVKRTSPGVGHITITAQGGTNTEVPAASGSLTLIGRSSGASDTHTGGAAGYRVAGVGSDVTWNPFLITIQETLLNAGLFDTTLPDLPVTTGAVAVSNITVFHITDVGATTTIPSGVVFGTVPPSFLEIHQIAAPVATGANYCSVGLAFDGASLYYDRCGDENIYKVDPITGALLDTFATGLPELPNCLAYDATRNGLWIGAQNCSASGMPIHFWNFDDGSVNLEFTIPNPLYNPATGEDFVSFCFCDGLAFNANSPDDPADDEIWFSDDVNRNIGVFRPDGTLVTGYDATTVDPTLVSNGTIGGNSGLAIGGDELYLGNNGHGDIFIADATTDPLMLEDQFLHGDERQEDMACDETTFSRPVIWVRTTPQGGQFPDVITAYEIAPGSCNFGGRDDGIFADNFESGDTSAWSSAARIGAGETVPATRSEDLIESVRSPRVRHRHAVFSTRERRDHLEETRTER